MAQTASLVALMDAARGPAMVRWVSPSLVRQQARPRLVVSSGLDSFVEGVLLSLGMFGKGTLHNDHCWTWWTADAVVNYSKDQPTVICMANLSWHPRQPAPVVKKNKPQSTFYKDVPFTKIRERTCGLSTLPWRPDSTAANRSWRRRRHSSPERPWSCRLRTPREKRWTVDVWVCSGLPSISQWLIGLLF